MSAAEKSTDDKQVVFLVGKSRGHEHGDRITVSKDRAADLVAAGLASYPANHDG